MDNNDVYLYSCQYCQFKNYDFNITSDHVQNCSVNSINEASDEETVDAEATGSQNVTLSSEEFMWNKDNIKLLLTIRFEMDEQFMKPKKKKKQIWDDVAKQMFNLGKYKVTGENCDNKFRTLMTTYRKIKDKSQISGSGKSPSWPYYNIINQLYGEKPSVNPRPELIGGSLQELDCNKDNNVDKIKSEAVEPFKLNYLKGNKNIKRQAVETSAQLYKKKMKIDEDRYKEESAKNEERWRERKQLEEKKIEAVNRLTAVFENIAQKLT